ncbi:His Kinase A (phospho-acceptor) domain-containing protein [Candidatus Kryptonium thompsonii]|nr:His Kinase A (phospho-acceptor) domain-containing protein [Candidatus Kryptonium thompsoni]
MNVIDSIESAVNSMIKKIGAKGAVIFLEGIDKNLKFGTDKFDEGCLMLSIPIKLSDGTSCYITLYGDNPFAKFEQNDFETELAFLRLYLENLKLTQEIELVKCDSVKLKNSIYEYIHLLAHELRKPLTGIIGFSEILRDEFKNLSERDIIDFIGNIKKSGDEMLATLKYLTEIMEVEMGKAELKLEKFNPLEVVSDVINCFTNEIKQKGLRVVINSDESFEIEADKKKFKEIVYQLISNAVKFSHEGSSIDVGIVKSGDNFEFSVRDTGIGIRPEDISKIFKPFPKIKSHLNGSGLGLALAKCFVELHGGKITVSSEYQVGTEFKVILPLDSGHNCLKKEEVKKYEVI